MGCIGYVVLMAQGVELFVGVILGYKLLENRAEGLVSVLGACKAASKLVDRDVGPIDIVYISIDWFVVAVVAGVISR